MSTNIIHSISVERDPQDPAVFVEKTSYSCSNVWSYDNKSRPRDTDVKRFSDSEKGNLAMFRNAQSWTYEFSSGCSRGFGVSRDLSPMQIFRRSVNRANKAGMRVPTIADPRGLVFASSRSEGPFPHLFVGEIKKALRDRTAAKNIPDLKSIKVPETFRNGEDLGAWAIDQGFNQFSLKALNTVMNEKTVLRFFIKNGEAFLFCRRSSRRGWHFSGRDYKMLSVAKVSQWMPKKTL